MGRGNKRRTLKMKMHKSHRKHHEREKRKREAKKAAASTSEKPDVDKVAKEPPV